MYTDLSIRFFIGLKGEFSNPKRRPREGARVASGVRRGLQGLPRESGHKNGMLWSVIMSTFQYVIMEPGVASCGM